MEASTLDDLLTETGWLRRLARSLVGEAGADDLVQDTVLIAAEKRPTDGRPLKPWLARVITNLARMRHRSTARREAREAVSEPTSPPARPDELVERVQTQRLLGELVLALGDPHRDIVLMHYVEGLTSAQVAARLGIADGTVRWRLKQALDELRARLDARQSRRTWMVAVGALAPRPHATASSVAGGILVKKIVVAIALVVIAVVVGVVMWPREYARKVTAEPDRVASSAPSSGGWARSADGIPAWLAPPGTKRARIAGHVTADGARLPGATVSLHLATLESDALATTITDPTGAFDFGDRPAVAYEVAAVAPTKAPTSIAVHGAEPRANDLAIALEGCRATVSGKVADAVGAPIAGARIRVHGKSGVVSADDGSYSLCVPVFDTRLIVNADGFGTIGIALRLDGDLHHDITLAPEGIIVGRVVDDTTGEAIAGATVQATGASPGQAWKQTGTSGADGTFTIDGLAPQQFQLVARTPNRGGGTLVTVRATATTPPVELRLSTLAAIRGVARDAKGPVAGARIDLGDKRPMFSLVAPTFTDDTGHFTLEGIPYSRIDLTAAPYGVKSPEQVIVDQPVVEVELELTSPRALEGRVLRKGEPVAGASVECSIPGGYGKSITTLANDRGEYSLLVPRGDRCAVVGSSTRRSLWSSSVLVTLAADGPTHLDVELDAAASIAGVVVDEHDQPVAGAAVSFESPHDFSDGTTDARGRFRVCCLTGGASYMPYVWPSPAKRGSFKLLGHVAPVAVATKDTQVEDLRLQIDNRRHSITGNVVDETGAPVADASVVAEGTFIGTGPYGVITPSTSITDERGAFTLTNLADGTYLVRASGADGSDGVARDIRAGTADITVEVERAATIVGSFTGFGPEPLIIARARDLDHARAQRAWTSRSHYWINGLPPGPYILSIQSEHGAQIQRVDVRAGDRRTIDLRPAGVGAVSVTVLERTTRRPVAGMLCQAFARLDDVSAYADQPPTSARRTNSTGVLVIPDAPLGPVRIECFDGPTSEGSGDTIVGVGTTAMATVIVVPHPTSPVDPTFDVEFRTLPLRVWVVDPGGAAERAGLLPDDRILTLDGESIADLSRDAFMNLLIGYPPGSPHRLGILRGDTSLTITLTLGEGS